MSTDPSPPRPRERIRRAGHAAAERLRRARRAMGPGLQRARTRIAETRLRKPSRKTLYWTGGVLGTVVAAVVIFLLVFDWNWMRGPVARYASARLHREVTIAGDLDVKLLSWTPGATVNRITIGNPAWAGKEPMAEIERLRVQVRLLPLFKGDVDLPLLQVTRPNVRLLRDSQGRATWDFSDGRRRDEPIRLPPIRRFIIEDGKLRMTDERRKLVFAGSISAAEKLGGGNRGFELSGQGSLNRAPFLLQVTGGPLLNIDRDVPYPFDADIRAGATRITAQGAVPKPFDLGHVWMNTTLQGPDMADLYSLTGVPLPNTPPYRVAGRFSRDDHFYRFQRIDGRLGDSDMGGWVTIDGSGDRPLMKADLRSKSLDFDDLAAVFGGSPKVGPGETASAQQKAIASQLNAQQRLLPDSPLNVERLRAMDAEVRYRATSIRDAPIPLRSGSARVKLERALLVADPVEFDLPQGKIAGEVRLNARNAVPVTDLDIRLSGARLEQLIPIRGGEPPLTGGLVGRAQLRGEGNSVHKAFANADGEVMVVVPGGEIRKAFAELMGVNVVKGLGLLLSKDQSKTDVRCAVAHFQATDGVLRANRIVFDTGPVLGTGSGTVNLATERVAFRIQGHPKKFRLVRLMAPITVEGPIRQPKVGIEAGKAVAQGGFAAALGALVSPIAAVLPFVDPGLAKDANCSALIAEAGRQGAPVRTAAR